MSVRFICFVYVSVLHCYLLQSSIQFHYWINHNLFIHSSVNKHLGYLSVLAFTTEAAINPLTHVLWWASLLISLRYIPRSERLNQKVGVDLASVDSIKQSQLCPLSLLRSKPNLNDLLCGNGAGCCKHFSFVIWHTLSFVSREHWQILQQREASLPGSNVLTWPDLVAHCSCHQKHTAHLHDRSLQYSRGWLPVHYPCGVLSSNFHSVGSFHGWLPSAPRRNALQWISSAWNSRKCLHHWAGHGCTGSNKVWISAGSRKWRSGPRTSLFLPWVLCLGPGSCSLDLL